MRQSVRRRGGQNLHIRFGIFLLPGVAGAKRLHSGDERKCCGRHDRRRYAGVRSLRCDGRRHGHCDCASVEIFVTVGLSRTDSILQLPDHDASGRTVPSHYQDGDILPATRPRRVLQTALKAGRARSEARCCRVDAEKAGCREDEDEGTNLGYDVLNTEWQGSRC